MKIGELAGQFLGSLTYWQRYDDEMTEEQKEAFIQFLDTLPFDVFLTNPIWDGELPNRPHVQALLYGS